MALDIGLATDLIYEAAVVPSLWPQALDVLSRQMGAIGTVLFTLSRGQSRWVASDGLRQGFSDLESKGLIAGNIRLARTIERGLTQVPVSDYDLLDDEEMNRDPLYGHIRKKGWGWFIGSAIEVPGGDQLVYNVERALKDGPFGADELVEMGAVHPHIARAGILAARIGLERTRAAAEALGVIGLPCGVISSSNRLLLSNALFEAYVPSLILDRQDRVHLANSRADAMLVSALKRVSMAPLPLGPLSIPVPASIDQPATVVHVLPVRRAANDVFSGASCLLVATPVARKAMPSAALIQGLFDLTAKEAMIAQGIGSGATLNDVAASANISVNTVKTHMKSIFGKTGVTRQADLVAQLSDIVLERPHGR